MPMRPIRATYRLACSPSEVESLAATIAREQTVEVPSELVARHPASHALLGRVEEIRAVGDRDGGFDVTIAYDAELSAYQLAQTLNLVYGNVSLMQGVRLDDLEFPDAYLARFRGPAFGVDGIRRLLGVYDRPLLATAIKPRGAPLEYLADVARRFAAGGGDIVKDDHNLVDASLDDFRRRVELCQRAVVEGARAAEVATLYLPNVSGTLETMEQQVEFAAALGIRGVLVAPLAIGLDTVRHLAARYGVAMMAHPTFTGTFFQDARHGIEAALLLGTLFRLCGCDVSVFPNYGGRFTFSADDCRAIAQRLRAPLGNISPSWPAPAGGMQYESLTEMAERYGPDAIFLIGGALLLHTEDLSTGARQFLDRIRERFGERRTEPAEPLVSAGDELAVSACETPAGESVQSLLEHLVHRGDFSWHGREPVVYKTSGELPFRDVRRVELSGKAGEETAFELRYFEIAPGGYSSLEKHQHAHVVIGARGRGVLLTGERRLELAPHDVAYVPPMRVHQLRNEATEPFGFYCIVDRQRDRPQAP